MNILHILHLPWLAGTETAYINLTKIIAKTNNTYCLIPKKALARPELEKINVSGIIENNKVFKNFGKFDILAKSYFKNLIKKRNINAVIVHNARILELLKPICKKLTIPIIAVNNGTNPKKTALADYAFVVNKTMFKAVESSGLNKNNILLVPNCINLEKRNLTKIGNSVPVLGFLGRFSYEKGCDIFLETLKILKEKGLKFKAIIGGDGPLKAQHIDYIKNNSLEDIVSFVGWVKEKEEFFSKIDIFCLTSRAESFGIVLLEAMLYNTPIIATKCDGPIDIIDNNINGLLAETKNPQDIAEKIGILMRDNILQKNLADEAFEKLKNFYTFDVISNRIEDFLNRVFPNKTKK